ncbi:MAG: hypothetical protein J6Y28_08255 [Acholeplasmatales bacterium]|nr:hypothetical protein [Acholeplasmatales bacterium]
MDRVIEILKGINPTVDYEKEDDLINHKLLKSFDIVRLVTELEDEFDIEISPAYVIPENFASAKTIYELVKKIEEE